MRTLLCIGLVGLALYLLVSVLPLYLGGEEQESVPGSAVFVPDPSIKAPPASDPGLGWESVSESEEKTDGGLNHASEPELNPDNETVEQEDYGLEGELIGWVGGDYDPGCKSDGLDRWDPLPYVGTLSNRRQPVLGISADICLLGFDATGADTVTVEITAPSGKLFARDEVEAAAEAGIWLTFFPDAELGVYAIRASTDQPDVATGEPVVVSGSFEVGVATSPLIELLDKTDPQRLIFGASGFPEGATVPVGLYRGKGFASEEEQELLPGEGNYVFTLERVLSELTFDSSRAASIVVDTEGFEYGEYYCVATAVQEIPCWGPPWDVYWAVNGTS
jgi:hypothetical protein